jgi:hypothetical protein
MIKTNIKSRDYETNEVCRIINPKQQLLYVKNGVYPLDIYTSIDAKTGKDILVMIFSREESRDLYTMWCNYELV